MNIDEFALKGETFKPLVAPFEKYLVSDYGRVWKFQHSVVDTLDKLAKEIEVKRFARLSN